MMMILITEAMMSFVGNLKKLLIFKVDQNQLVRLTHNIGQWVWLLNTSRALKPRLHDRPTTCCQNGCQTVLTTGCILYTAGCQTGCTTRFDNRLNEQPLFVQHRCQTVFVKTVVQRGLTTGYIM